MKSIYFDNAASGGYKPDCVKKAILQALESPSDPGRSRHKAALAAALVSPMRATIRQNFFGAKGGNVVFTYNCTAALNFPQSLAALAALMLLRRRLVITRY